MKIAWFTPFSTKSAIGKYSSYIVDLLAKSHEVTVFADGVDKREDTWLPKMPMVLLKQTPAREVARQLPGFDAVIYNLGDNLAFHQHIYEVSQLHPGIVILHDLVMHHFFIAYCVDYKKSKESYLNELAYSHSQPGRDLGRRILSGTIDQAIWMSALMLDFPMVKSAVRGAYGIIAHSQSTAKIVEKFATAPVKHVFFPLPHIETKTRNISDNTVHILTFGVLNRNKQIHAVIEAIARSETLRNSVVYEVIGSGNKEYVRELNDLINQHGLQKQVKLVGYQDDDVLHQAIANSDIVVNLRHPHFGESSISLVEAMAVGKPTVVWNHGFYGEFPDNTVLKVTSVESIQSALERLTADKPFRESVGKSAAQYIHDHFVTERTVQDILNFIQETRYNTPVFRLLDSLVNEMKIMGVDEQVKAFPDLVVRTVAEISSES